MKVKKVNKNQALLILGGASAALAGNSATLSAVAHADTTNKTTKVSNKNDSIQQNAQGQEVTKINPSNSGADSNMELVTVVEGDTTWEIAQEHNTTVDQIVKDNHLKNGGALIHIDDKLKVRATDNTASLSTNSTTTTATQQTTTTNSTTSSADQTQSSNYSTNSNSQATKSNYSNYSNTRSQSSYSNYYAPAPSTASQSQNTQASHSTTYKSNVAGNEAAAKEWIAARESGGSYTARNASSGAYGRYQLLPGYLHGDYSPANQEKVADNYVQNRYGSWTNAKAFWQSHNWY